MVLELTYTISPPDEVGQIAWHLDFTAFCCKILITFSLVHVAIEKANPNNKINWNFSRLQEALHTNIKFVFKLRITICSLFLYPLSVLFLFCMF